MTDKDIFKNVLLWVFSNHPERYKNYIKLKDPEKRKLHAKQLLSLRIEEDPDYLSFLPIDLIIRIGIGLDLNYLPDQKEDRLIKAINGELIGAVS